MPTHGLASTYRHGCRCELCRDANTDFCKQQRTERSNRPVDDIPHGLSGYQNWDCRCEVCKAAKSEKNAAAYQASRGSAA